MKVEKCVLSFMARVELFFLAGGLDAKELDAERPPCCHLEPHL